VNGASDSDCWLQRFEVSFEYPVYFTRGVFAPASPVLADAIGRLEPTRRQRALVVVDEGVAGAWPGLGEAIGRYAAAHAARLELVAPPLVLPGGEVAKNDPAQLGALLARLHALRLDRHASLVVVGGGALQDMAGFAAATCHRGVRVVRVPTTVLAQNDAGVGVKSGVNAFGAKNFLGAFAPPFAVIDDFDFLSTLAPRDRRAGMAEAVKVAALRDPAFFTWLEAEAPRLAGGDDAALARLVRRAAELHLAHIATGGDPFERGSARPLDYGHWSAHKLETLSGHRLRHGEAVAIGMALDACYAARAGVLGAGAAGRLLALLEALGLRLFDPALRLEDADGRPAVLAGIEEFREHLGGELTVTLLTAIGKSAEVHALREDGIAEAIGELEARDAGACS
jgi:3-dehydroquinate synthase